jgi:hypothetical protein
MPKGKVDDPITDQEIAFAHLILAGKLTDREAAEAVGISPGQANYVKVKPRVKEYMTSHRASVRAGLVQHEVDALAKFNISREQILAKWWEFASIDPAKTGYNTSSQSKALDYLWNALGYADSNPKKPGEGEGEGDSKPNIYVAAWMRKPGDPDYEEDDGETAGSREISTRREPVMSDPGPSSNPGACPQSQPGRAEEPSRLRPSAGFGRFQGL